MLSQPQRRNICGRASLSSSAAPPRQTPRFTQGDRSVGPGESSKYLLIGLAGAGSGFPADRASGSPCRKRDQNVTLSVIGASSGRVRANLLEVPALGRLPRPGLLELHHGPTG